MKSKITDQINALKKEKNAIILVHNYQPLEIQGIADFLGDSLGLAIAAKNVKADIIIVCGVVFMAESAKIVNPTSKVLIPKEEAICTMAKMVTVDDVINLRKKYPEGIVITYANSTADVKAQSNICCTSSNAIKIIEQLPDDKEIIFLPDKNLGNWVKYKTKKNVILWNGYCCVHEMMRLEHLKARLEEYPNAKSLIHPEAPLSLLKEADFVASTSGMIEIVNNAKAGSELIIGTELGLVDQLQKDNPDKTIIHLFKESICQPMKYIGLEDVLKSLKNEQYEIKLDNDILEKSKIALEKMIEMSN